MKELLLLGGADFEIDKVCALLLGRCQPSRHDRSEKAGKEQAGELRAEVAGLYIIGWPGSEREISTETP
jgi:hypothetical protein